MRAAKIEKVHPTLGGTQKIFRFKNNYGASVIKTSASYGGDQGMWELAVIWFGSDKMDSWEIVYDTPIGNDVIGYLENNDVDELLDRIELLPSISVSKMASNEKRDAERYRWLRGQDANSDCFVLHGSVGHQQLRGHLVISNDFLDSVIDEAMKKEAVR